MDLQVSAAFDLREIGMICFIRNVENGLPENTILISASRNREWCVKYRRLWMHSANAVPRFANEKESIGRSSFDFSNPDEDPISRSIEIALEMGNEYCIEPISHTEKPYDGEMLKIKLNETSHELL